MPVNNSDRHITFISLNHPDWKLLEFFLTFNLIIVGELICCLGIMGNIINIMNFSKQGMQDSVNVTLTALAVSDIGALICQMVLNILLSPFWRYVVIPFSSSSAMAMVFFYPRAYFIRVSGFITTFAAFERCLCVTLPLKVKNIITSHVAMGVNVFAFALFSLYLFPIYYVSYADWSTNLQTNRSVLTIFYKENAELVLTFANIINDLFVPYTTFFILIVCTTILILKLRSKAKWRHSVSQLKDKDDPNRISGKERRTVRMLVTVSIIFIACLTPECVMSTVIGIYQDLKVEGPYWDVTLMCFSFTLLLETINCSVTCLVYYSMSTKYKKIIISWFLCLQ